MKRSYLTAILMVLVALAWIGSGLFASEPPPPAEDAAATTDEATTPTVLVRLSEARNREVVLSLFGRTEANRQVDLKAETEGRIVDLPVEKGTRVTAGTLLARLSMDDRQARLAEAQALLQQRQIEYQAAEELAEKSFRSKTKLAETRAALQSARAAVAAARLDIAQTSIEAPFDGVLDARPAELGAYVAIGDPVVTLVDPDPLLVVGEVGERDVRHLSVGDVATARLVSGEEVTGVIRYISVVAEAPTRTFQTELEVANPDHRLAVGITASLRLSLHTEQAHLLSPSALTLADDGRVGVRALDDDDRVIFLPVRIVDDTPDGMWVADLPERVRLIILGQEFVKAGQKVRAVTETEAL